MKKKEFIKCCPFCGSHEVDVCRTNPNACWIECPKCWGRSTSHKTRSGAIRHWNRRHYDDVPSRIVEDDDREHELGRRGESHPRPEEREG